MIRTGIISLIVLLAAAGVCQGMDVGIFQGDASIEIGSDTITSAKFRGRNEALKQAVEKAVMQIAPADVYQKHQKQINKSIVKKAGNYVKSYEILKSAIEDGRYLVSLEARVDLGKLLTDIRKIGDIKPVKRPEKNRILLVVTKKTMDTEEFWPPLYDYLAARFRLAGLEPISEGQAQGYIDSDSFEKYIENRLDPTFDDGVKYQVRYALVIRTMVLVDQGGGCPHLGKGRFLDLGNRYEMANFEISFDEGTGCETAAKEKAVSIFATLNRKLEGKGVFDAGPEIKTFVHVTGVKAYKDTTELSAQIKLLPDIKSISLHSFGTGGRVVYKVTYAGTAESLTDAIANLKPKGFKLIKRFTEGGQILFEVKY